MEKRIQSAVSEMLREALQTQTADFVFSCPGGMINQNGVFTTDSGHVFVKVNQSHQSKAIFDGEVAGLNELRQTGVVRVPEPLQVSPLTCGGSALVMEYLDLTPLNSPKHFSQLGEQIAHLHEVNHQKLVKVMKSEGSVHQSRNEADKLCNNEFTSQFGFHTVTSCGHFLQDTSWTGSWQDYFARKMQQHVTLIERDYRDVFVCESWNILLQKLSAFFEDIDIYPSLLHGDIWDKNLGVTGDDQLVVVDPSCYYGHSEMDLALPSLCSDPLWRHFFHSYHTILPKSPGFQNRAKLYQLYHHLNHWNHFPPKVGQTCGDEVENVELAKSTFKELLK